MVDEPGAEEARGNGDAEPSPESVEEALARARQHALAATGEALGVVHALLDAASLASGAGPSHANRALAPLARLLEDLELRLCGDAGAEPSPVLAAVADALDAEIGRWEQRAANDGEARAVLRAFLGLRELLWEFGVRPSPGGSTEHAAPGGRSGSGRPGAAPGRGRRVQRVPVEG